MMNTICKTCQHELGDMCMKPLAETDASGEHYHELLRSKDVLSLDGTCHVYAKKTIKYKIDMYVSQKVYSFKMMYWTVRSFFKNNLYGRIKYGFNIEETWNLDDTITKFIYPRLKYLFNESYGGHPAMLDIEFCNEHNLNQYNLDEVDNMMDIWSQIKSQILYGFDMMYKQNKTFETLTKEQHVEVQESLRLFALFYTNLWS